MGQVVSSLCSCCCPNKKEVREKIKDKSSETIKSQRPPLQDHWENLNQKKSLTPSQVPDDTLSRFVNLDIDERKTDEFRFDKTVLEHENYEIASNSSIGKGGFGIVYKAEHKSGVIYAAKVIELTIEKESNKNRRFEAYKNEVFLLKRNPHNNIIKLIDHFVCQNIYFIILEFANYGNLEDKIKEYNKPFPENIAKTYFIQICNAIYHLHSKGITHGDLKLSNILLTIVDKKEVLKVCDLGCARICYSKETGIIMKTKVMGTVSYMSPEMIAAYIRHNLKRPDLVKDYRKSIQPFKADMWALGVCLYKLVNEHRPFGFESKKDPKLMIQRLNVMKSGFKLRPAIYKKLSTECIEVMKALLEFDVYKRIDIKIVVATKWIFNSPLLDITEQNE